MRDASGTPLFYEGTVEDVSEKVRLEAQLLRAQRVESVGARFGRVRIIKLEPSTSEDEVSGKFLHLDDNNRLNADGEGWVVRSWLNLTEDPDSYMIVREDKDDPATESHIPLPKGAQFVVDTERLWHAVYHPGTAPRYALITSFESGPELDTWITATLP